MNIMKNEEFRRETDPDKTIRFYVCGRRNGGKGGGKRDRYTGHSGSGSEQGGFYWTSEPAKWSDGLFGRCLWFVGPDSKPNQGYRWFVSPVAGSAGSNGDPKWQRTHGLAVRPMRDP